MIDLKFIDDLSRRLADAMPPAARAMQQDIEKNMRAVLHSAFDKMELVTREEFEVQQKVLEYTRTKLEDLERQVMELQARLTESGR